MLLYQDTSVSLSWNISTTAEEYLNQQRGPRTSGYSKSGASYEYRDIYPDNYCDYCSLRGSFKKRRKEFYEIRTSNRAMYTIVPHLSIRSALTCNTSAIVRRWAVLKPNISTDFRRACSRSLNNNEIPPWQILLTVRRRIFGTTRERTGARLAPRNIRAKQNLTRALQKLPAASADRPATASRWRVARS